MLEALVDVLDAHDPVLRKVVDVLLAEGRQNRSESVDYSHRMVIDFDNWCADTFRLPLNLNGNQLLTIRKVRVMLLHPLHHHMWCD